MLRAYHSNNGEDWFIFDSLQVSISSTMTLGIISGSGGNMMGMTRADKLRTFRINSTISNTTVVNNNSSHLFYPNPTKGIVYYQYDSPEAEQLQVELLDVLGKRHMQFVQGTTGSNNIPINLNELPAGIYTVKIYHEILGIVITGKIIKQE